MAGTFFGGIVASVGKEHYQCMLRHKELQHIVSHAGGQMIGMAQNML